MRNVVRSSNKPGTLDRNGERWKRELLQEIRNAERDGRKVDNKFYNKYNQRDIKDALSLMYAKLCCYCEAAVVVVTKGHIEHRKPKKGPNAFPELTFEWDNLHLVCETCNRTKSDQWDDVNEILDAVQDVPIDTHFTYELSREGVFRSARTRRGETTIKHADLNRNELLEARMRILTGALEVIRELRRIVNNPRAVSKRDILEAKGKREYGTLIEFAVREFLEN